MSIWNGVCQFCPLLLSRTRAGVLHTSSQLGIWGAAVHPHVWTSAKQWLQETHRIFQQHRSWCDNSSVKMVWINWKKKEMVSAGLQVEAFHFEVDPHRVKCSSDAFLNDLEWSEFFQNIPNCNSISCDLTAIQCRPHTNPSLFKEPCPVTGRFRSVQMKKHLNCETPRVEKKNCQHCHCLLPSKETATLWQQREKKRR